jgi:ABC-2 type transport system permease protein
MDLGQVNWGALLLSIVVTVAATSCLGVTMGSIGLVLTSLNLFGNLLVVAMMAFCGIQFPVSVLPRWLQVFSYAMPMTRGADAARLAVAGGGPGLWGLLLGEAVVGLVWLLVGYGLFRLFEHQARKHGTLELY